MTSPATSVTAKNCRESGVISELRSDSPGSPFILRAIRVSGSDAASFLHSQLTNEVKALKPGDGNLSARVTRTGTLVSYFSLHRLLEDPAAFLLLIHGENAAADAATLLADLGKFAVVEDVALDDVTVQFDWIAIQGPNAVQACEAVFGPLKSASTEPQPWHDLSECGTRVFHSFPCAGAFAIARSLAGDPGFILAIPREAEMLDDVIARFQSSVLGKDFVRASRTDSVALNALRIEAGVLAMGVDVQSGKIVLPETGLEQAVVSYSKGCYLGQEVIARIRTYGSVPFVLRGLIFECDPHVLEKLPDLDAELALYDGTKIGRIASRAWSPVFEAPIAFAFLDRTHRTPGTKLKIKGNDGSILNAEVRLLPFYRAADTASRVAFLHDRAIRLFAAGDDAKAQELLEEALRLDPSFADGYEALGVLLGRTGKFTEAIDIFKRLEEVAPNEPMVHTNLSLFYMKLGDKVAAEEEKAKGVVKQFGKFAGAKKAEQVAAEEAAKRKADAERKRAMFEEVLDIDPDDPVALFGLGNALSTLGDWEGAERVLSKSCAVQADNSAAFLARGKALEMLSREADAVRVYKDGMAVASKKGDLMPLKEMERRVLLLGA